MHHTMRTFCCPFGNDADAKRWLLPLSFSTTSFSLVQFSSFLFIQSSVLVVLYEYLPSVRSVQNYLVWTLLVIIFFLLSLYSKFSTRLAVTTLQF